MVQSTLVFTDVITDNRLSVIQREYLSYILFIKEIRN